MLWATVASVYRIEVVDLDPLRLVLLGTALEVAVLVFEVPTGVLADTYGRRRSVITGFLLMGSGFALEGAVPTFAAVLAAQAVWGVGYTFIAGRWRPGSRTKPPNGTSVASTCAASRPTTRARSSAS
jgi:DHA3 family tetracycline resistance protein-like MFS transporter